MCTHNPDMEYIEVSIYIQRASVLVCKHLDNLPTQLLLSSLLYPPSTSASSIHCSNTSATISGVPTGAGWNPPSAIISPSLRGVHGPMSPTTLLKLSRNEWTALSPGASFSWNTSSRGKRERSMSVYPENCANPPVGSAFSTARLYFACASSRVRPRIGEIPTKNLRLFGSRPRPAASARIAATLPAV